MNAQEVILANINNGHYSKLILAMLIMAFFILGQISVATLVSDLALISWTYDTTAHTVSDGTTTYTVDDLISGCIATTYAEKPELGVFVMKTVINSALTENYITSAEATTLKAALTA
jgi:hypothetical protein